MKSIMIREPWASKIANGEKTIETRTWKTNHRGKILLCASRNPSGEFSGKCFATADLVDVRPMEKNDEVFAGCKKYPRAYSWILDNVQRINPKEVKGQLGLFNVD